MLSQHIACQSKSRHRYIVLRSETRVFAGVAGRFVMAAVAGPD